MNEIVNTLTVFFNIMKEDILDYYQKTYSYLKDLITYKKIDLDKKIEAESENDVRNTLSNMLKVLKTGLNTIGISLDDLNKIQIDFLSSLSKENVVIVNYDSYFEIYLKDYVNKLLFEILIDYLIDIDFKKLENVNLFDLLPPYFISKLNEFKKSHFSSAKINEIFKKQEYYKFINFTDLTIVKPEKPPEPDILTQLRTAKEGFIESLKSPKTELFNKPIDAIAIAPRSKELAHSLKIKEAKTQIEPEFNLLLNTGTFIDYFGNFNPIHPDIIREFEIDKLNLINLKVVNREYFDLENLFYYLSILKMLNLESPFTNNEIVDILKNFINRWVFSSSTEDVPDIHNNFYGLAIFSELDLFNKKDLIDLQEIDNFVSTELKIFVPEKLQLNLYSLLCLRLITILQKKSMVRELNLESIVNLDLLSLNNFKPTFDMYNHLTALKLLGKEKNINNVKETYINEIKKLININGSIDDLITESARALLILSLLNLREQEPDLCANLLNFILNKTSFFFSENIDKNFNWRSDKLGFKIELEMLYWSLLASSQFAPKSY